MGKIYARLIYAGAFTFEQVPIRFQEATELAYEELYGIPVPKGGEQ